MTADTQTFYHNNEDDDVACDALLSREFQALIRVDAIVGTRSFHPVYVIGYESHMIRVMRDSYIQDTPFPKDDRRTTFRVGIYGVFDPESLQSRIGIPPSVIVLAPHVDLDGVVRSFIRAHHVQVLRLQKRRTVLDALPCREYYGSGVYETFQEDQITNTKMWTDAINIGILVWLRTRGFRDSLSAQSSHSTQSDSAPVTMQSLRESKALRRSKVQPTAPDFTSFATAKLRDLGIPDERAQEEVLKSLPPESVFDFKNAGSDHDLGAHDAHRDDTPHPLFGDCRYDTRSS